MIVKKIVLCVPDQASIILTDNPGLLMDNICSLCRPTVIAAVKFIPYFTAWKQWKVVIAISLARIYVTISVDWYL